MSTIAERRQEIADLINGAFPEFTVVPYAESGNLTLGDGFVTFMGPITLDDFNLPLATFALTLVVATDPEEAAHKLDEIGYPVLRTLVQNIFATNVSALSEPLVDGDQAGAGVVYALTVTLTLEVE